MLTLGMTSAALLILIWFGYPLLVRVLAAFRRTPSRERESARRSVSVVLASRDSTDAIRARVADILQTGYPHCELEVIVALDATRPKSSEEPETFGPQDSVRVVRGDEPGGKSATLNAGVRAAKHDVLVFTDTAQRFEPGAIEALVVGLAEPGVGAVSGMLELPGHSDGSLNLAERYWRYERWLRHWEARLHSCVGVTGAVYAMPRALWEALPANLILDDLYVPMRLGLQGWRIGFTPHARARDVRRFAPAQEYRRKVRTLTGNIQICAWLPDVLNPLRNPIWLQFVFHKLFRLLTPYLVLLSGLGIAWFLIAMLLSTRGGAQALLAVGVFGALLCLVPRVRRMLKGPLAWGVALQSSVVMATVNGVRGKWDVWH